MPLPTKGSFSAGHIKPKHGTKSDRDKYFAALKRMEIDKEIKMARSLERLSRQKLDDDTGFNDMNVEKEATIIKLKEDVKNEFFQDVVDRMKQEDKTAPNYGYLPPVEVNHHDMDSIKALNKFEDVELDDGTEEFLTKPRFKICIHVTEFINIINEKLNMYILFQKLRKVHDII